MDTFGNLPEELLVEILLKVSVKSLVRSISVSKAWESLIKSPQFIYKHLKTNKKTTPLLFSRHCSVSENGCCLNFYDEEFNEFKQIKFPHKGFTIAASFNGLLCVRYDHQGSSLAQWNPSINKWMPLPKPTVSLEKLSFCCYNVEIGVGFDSSTNDLKLLKFVGKDSFIRVELYSTNSNSWRNVTAKIAPNYRSFHWCRGHFVNGSIHLVRRRKKYNGTRIIAFNVREEAFHELMPPKDLASASKWHGSVWKYQESSILLARKNIERLEFDIWVMKEYGVAESWSKVFHLGFQGLMSPMPLGFRDNNGEMLLAVSNHNSEGLASVDLRKGKMLSLKSF